MDFKSLISTNIEGFLYVFAGDQSRSVSERKEKPMSTNGATVLSINVGRVREFDYNGRPAKSAIWKTPVDGRIAVRGVNLEGDDQADRKAHGGPDKVVYAYATEDVRWWEEKLGRSLQYGEFGENLTTEGIAVNDAPVGERWAIGTAVFEVSEPRIPCWRLGVRMHDQGFVRRFTEALRPGTYLRVIVAGAVGAGDEIRIIERPAHDLTIRDIFRIYTRDREEVERLLAVPSISESWRGWAQHFLEETKSRRAASAPPGCC
jgi:MOSC domain-containing protein YiiM